MYKTYVIAGIYRHPNGDTKHFNNDLTGSLSKLDKDHICILGGDIDIDLMEEWGY